MKKQQNVTYLLVLICSLFSWNCKGQEPIKPREEEKNTTTSTQVTQITYELVAESYAEKQELYATNSPYLPLLDVLQQCEDFCDTRPAVDSLEVSWHTPKNETKFKNNKNTEDESLKKELADLYGFSKSLILGKKPASSSLEKLIENFKNDVKVAFQAIANQLSCTVDVTFYPTDKDFFEYWMPSPELEGYQTLTKECYRQALDLYQLKLLFINKVVEIATKTEANLSDKARDLIKFIEKINQLPPHRDALGGPFELLKTIILSTNPDVRVSKIKKLLRINEQSRAKSDTNVSFVKSSLISLQTTTNPEVRAYIYDLVQKQAITEWWDKPVPKNWQSYLVEKGKKYQPIQTKSNETPYNQQSLEETLAFIEGKELKLKNQKKAGTLISLSVSSQKEKAPRKGNKNKDKNNNRSTKQPISKLNPNDLNTLSFIEKEKTPQIIQPSPSPSPEKKTYTATQSSQLLAEKIFIGGQGYKETTNVSIPIINPLVTIEEGTIQKTVTSLPVKENNQLADTDNTDLNYNKETETQQTRPTEETFDFTKEQKKWNNYSKEKKKNEKIPNSKEPATQESNKKQIEDQTRNSVVPTYNFVLPQGLRTFHTTIAQGCHPIIQITPHQNTVDDLFDPGKSCKITYKEFKTLWIYHGGCILSKKGGSHRTLQYPPEVNLFGIYAPHGKYTTYGLKSIKYIQTAVLYIGLRPTKWF